MTLFWKRAVGGDSSPIVADAGDHVACRILRISGCITSGDPWSGTPVWTVDSVADTSMDAAGPTTAVDECLVLIWAANVIDTNTQQTVTYVNANLTGLVPSGFGDNTQQGTGGGFNVGVGVKDTAGSVGNTTLTWGAATQKSVAVIALRPAPFTPDASTYLTRAIRHRPRQAPFRAVTRMEGFLRKPSVILIPRLWQPQEI
jgi:hypothetical protein